MQDATNFIASGIIGLLVAALAGLLLLSVGIFIWGARSGGNLSHPIAMFEYFWDLFFSRLRDRIRPGSPRHARAAVRAAPDRVSPLSEQEGAFFFLHEIELETGLQLRHGAAGEIIVSKREYRKLEGYFHFASKPTTAHGAFAHHGLHLSVTAEKKLRGAAPTPADRRA